MSHEDVVLLNQKHLFNQITTNTLIPPSFEHTKVQHIVIAKTSMAQAAFAQATSAQAASRNAYQKHMFNSITTRYHDSPSI